MKVIYLFMPMLLLLCCCAIISPSSSQAGDNTIVIIVNNSVSVTSMSVAEVKRLFLKKRSSWKTGEKVSPVNARSGSTARKIFQSKILNMNDNEEKSYWQALKIKKGITPPREFSNTQRAVFSLEGSIGYCLKAEYKAGTSKIILTL